MFSFFKKKNRLSEVPGWASFFEANEYQKFIQSVEEYFAGKNIRYTLTYDGVIQLPAGNEFAFENMGLVNVAQVCKGSAPENYRAIVTDHFEGMLRAKEFETRFEGIVHDFDQVKQYIGVRLYANESVEHLGKQHTIGKDLAGDIYAMLIFDFPHSVINVKPDQAEKWGKTSEDLFTLGLQNIRTNYQLDISEQPFNDFKIWFVTGEHHFYAPNVVFDLKNHPELIGSKGALIGIPHRHAVLIYPIESLEVVTALNALIPVVYGMNQEGPGSISNYLFWYKDGHFENLPYKIEDKTLQFFPPQNFVELLNTLQK